MIRLFRVVGLLALIGLLILPLSDSYAQAPSAKEFALSELENNVAIWQRELAEDQVSIEANISYDYIDAGHPVMSACGSFDTSDIYTYCGADVWMDEGGASKHGAFYIPVAYANWLYSGAGGATTNGAGATRVMIAFVYGRHIAEQIASMQGLPAGNSADLFRSCLAGAYSALSGVSSAQASSDIATALAVQGLVGDQAGPYINAFVDGYQSNIAPPMDPSTDGFNGCYSTYWPSNG